MGRRAKLPPDWEVLYLRVPRDLVTLLNRVKDRERLQRPGRLVSRAEVAIALLYAGATAALGDECSTGNTPR